MRILILWLGKHVKISTPHLGISSDATATQRCCSTGTTKGINSIICNRLVKVFVWQRRVRTIHSAAPSALRLARHQLGSGYMYMYPPAGDGCYM